MSRPPAVPVTLDTLPRVTGGESAASIAFARVVAGLPPRLATEAGGIGPVTVELDGVELGDRVQGAAAGPVERFALALADVEPRASLVVPSGFAIAVVRAILGAPPAIVERPLAPTERGVLAALAAHVASASGFPTRVELAGAPSSEAPPAARVRLRVRAGGLLGIVGLEVPPSWIERGARRGGAPLAGPAAHLAGSAARLASAAESEARLELARTRLEARAWATARPGDAVVFDGVPAMPEGGASDWPVRFSVGWFAAHARWRADGQLEIDSPFFPDPSAERLDMRNDSETSQGQIASAQSAPAAAEVAASAPVEIVAEIGRVLVSAGEIAGLVPGVVLPLGARRADPVSLRAGGHVWARGELVSVDGELAVRITEVFGR